ncbi:MAG TPA: PQQ-binding-like beta-propeller repeat protein [Candidatus Brocadiia bacterium]|nr:PQQ-binding-like beta-propeller repeat protein [Candidatus Brocadiia bacterium]
MVLFVAICGIASADWPQFLGPQRDGIAHDVKALPTSLAEENVKQIWKVDLGSGFGAPVIFGDSVFVLDREGNDRDILRRIDVQTGKEKWRFTYPAPGKVDYNGSRQSPSVDGKMVYAIGPFGHINAVRMEDGTAVWSGHIIKDWDGAFPNWGVAQSPLLMGDNIIIAPWGKKAAVVALEKATGKVVWTSPNPDGIVMDYQSPMPMKLGERQTIVACGTKGYAIGVDAATGERLWTYKGYECRHHIPSPTVLEGGRVLLTGGYSAGSAMIKVEQKDGAYAVTELWKNSNVASKIPQPLVHNGHIYSNSSDNNGGLRCVTEAGEIKWDSKKKGRTFDMGNLIMVDDLIFIVDGKGGKLHMVKVNPNEYEELGRISPLSGKEVWAPLAYSDGKLVLRDQKKMVCLQFKRQGD